MKTMTYTIEKNIPLPNDGNGRGRGKSELRLTLEKMEIGDSIVVPKKKRDQVATMTRALGTSYQSRRIGLDQYRVWRIAGRGTN
jgi:hypothetical protein|tara:strand:+ start:185 stop:436 length:252 start_codon:yes stop_codon:yes gene_type:complete